MIKKINWNGIIMMLSIWVIATFSAMAQNQITVRGTIADAFGGLAGVNVIVQGTHTGTVSNIDGQYEITTTSGAVLLFSFVGYSPQELLVTESGVFDIIMLPDFARLDELVIIGYGVQRKRDATGSVTVVDSRDFNMGNIASPTELLSGRVAGVQIISGGGAPGTGATIRIRSGSSLRATNDPLIVIDGVPIAQEGIGGIRNPLSMINPTDIESFTVLKDASAAAIYGSRASNGVIIITTKRAQLGTPLRVEYSGTYSLSTIDRSIDVLSADEFRSTITDRFQRPGGAIWNFINTNLGTANTDWQSEIFRDAMSQDHTLSISGATGFLPYRASINYSVNDGILKTDNMTRASVALSLNPRLLDDHLNINFNIRGMQVDNFFADVGAITAAIQFDPTQPVFDNTSPYGGYFTWVDRVTNLPRPVATSNPVALLNMREDISTVNRLLGNTQIDYRFHFMPELRANLNLAYDYSQTEGSVFVPDNAPWAYFSGGLDMNHDQETRNQLLDFYLSYNSELPAIESTFDIMAGYSWQHFWRRGSAVQTNLRNNIGGVAFRLLQDSFYASESFLISFFGRVNYTFKDRYLFTITLRNDGSSRFIGENQWGLFPSAAFAWQIINEPFMQNNNLFSDLKLRLGYGITGQQGVGGDYPALARYTFSRDGASYQFGDTFIRTLRPEGYDANLKWEETTTYNVGLDFAFAQGRYYGSIDYYVKDTRDLINFIPVPAGSNLTNFIETNIGNMRNSGVEFSIFTRPIAQQDMTWQLGFNATYNHSEITKLTAVEDPDYLGVLTGGITGGVGNTIQVHSVGFAPNSFFVFQQVYDTAGNPIEGAFVDRNGDGIISDDDRYHLKRPASEVFLGINSILNYKNWDFSFAGRANFGNYVYNNVSSLNGIFARLYRGEGPYLSNITPDALTTGFNNAQYISDYYVQNGSFFKMDFISIGYNFNDLPLINANLRISATVQNAFLITKYQGLDPEIAYGIDNNIYPRPRNFVLGLNLQF